MVIDGPGLRLKALNSWQKHDFRTLVIIQQQPDKLSCLVRRMLYAVKKDLLIALARLSLPKNSKDYLRRVVPKEGHELYIGLDNIAQIISLKPV